MGVGEGGSCCQRALLEKEQVWGRWQGGSERLLTWVRSSKARERLRSCGGGGRAGDWALGIGSWLVDTEALASRHMNGVSEHSEGLPGSERKKRKL